MTRYPTAGPIRRRSLAVSTSGVVAIIAMLASAPAPAHAIHHSPPTHTSRLLRVHWQQVAGRDLDCHVPGLGLEPPVVRYHDITGDGFPDSVVVLRCRTGDSSAFDQLEVFDGASDPGIRVGWASLCALLVARTTS